MGFITKIKRWKYEKAIFILCVCIIAVSCDSVAPVSCVKEAHLDVDIQISEIKDMPDSEKKTNLLESYEDVKRAAHSDCVEKFSLMSP